MINGNTQPEIGSFNNFQPEISTSDIKEILEQQLDPVKILFNHEYILKNISTKLSRYTFLLRNGEEDPKAISELDEILEQSLNKLVEFPGQISLLGQIKKSLIDMAYVKLGLLEYRNNTFQTNLSELGMRFDTTKIYIQEVMSYNGTDTSPIERKAKVLSALKQFLYEANSIFSVINHLYESQLNYNSDNIESFHIEAIGLFEYIVENFNTILEENNIDIKDLGSTKVYLDILAVKVKDMRNKEEGIDSDRTIVKPYRKVGEKDNSDDEKFWEGVTQEQVEKLGAFQAFFSYLITAEGRAKYSKEIEKNVTKVDFARIRTEVYLQARGKLLIPNSNRNSQKSVEEFNLVAHLDNRNDFAEFLEYLDRLLTPSQGVAFDRFFVGNLDVIEELKEKAKDSEKYKKMLTGLGWAIQYYVEKLEELISDEKLKEMRSWVHEALLNKSDGTKRDVAAIAVNGDYLAGKGSALKNLGFDDDDITQTGTDGVLGNKTGTRFEEYRQVIGLNDVARGTGPMFPTKFMILLYFIDILEQRGKLDAKGLVDAPVIFSGLPRGIDQTFILLDDNNQIAYPNFENIILLVEQNEAELRVLQRMAEDLYFNPDGIRPDDINDVDYKGKDTIREELIGVGASKELIIDVRNKIGGAEKLLRDRLSSLITSGLIRFSKNSRYARGKSTIKSTIANIDTLGGKNTIIDTTGKTKPQVVVELKDKVKTIEWPADKLKEA
ncbi:MAG: hypothetical protein ABI721_02510 [Candidatus Dojkabacteria bacterium]